MEAQFNPVKQFLNLFSKTIPNKLLPLREVKHCIDPKPESEWLSNWKLSAYKFGWQINDKPYVEVESGRVYPTTNNQNTVVILCIAKWN